MTNARDIKKVFQPLVERYGDLFRVSSNSLCISPVRHITFRLMIERSAHADFSVPQWTMLENFQPDLDMNLTIGKYPQYLFRKTTSPEKSWLWSDPSMVADLITTFEDEALPLARSIDTLEKYASFYREQFDGYCIEFPETRLIVDIALGNLETAVKSWRKLAPQYLEDKYPDWWLYQNNRIKVMTVAEPLLAGDRVALAKILHGWEADNIRGTKIEPYWEPTPFPLETGGT